MSKSCSCKRLWKTMVLWHVEALTLSRQSAHKCWWCQPHAPATLYPQEDSWYSFMLEAESTPGAIEKHNEWPHQESNLRPSGLWHSSSTNCGTAYRYFNNSQLKIYVYIFWPILAIFIRRSQNYKGLCRIWGFHGNDYEESHLFGVGDV
jgi:hypothetical protein